MRKSALALVMIAFTLGVNAQEKWRTLTLSSTIGSTIEGQVISTTSANISYELSNGISIESWTGFNYTQKESSSWLSNQTTLNKSLKYFEVGVGVMYNSGFVSIAQQPTDDFYGVLTISKRFKL